MTPEGHIPREAEDSSEQYHLSGRVLYLTQDPDLIRQQIDGENIHASQSPELAFGVSTDEIAPNRICLQYTGHEKNLLGNNLLTGFRGGAIKPGDILNGGFEVVVAGRSLGRGSSRYHAPIAFHEAGIKVLITEPAERIFSENAVNAGINILHPDSAAARILLKDKQIPISMLREHLSPLSKDIMEAGSLVRYLKMLHEGKFAYPIPPQFPRPMTMIEKMIARRVCTDNMNTGVNYVQPGNEVIARPDRYYGYELQTTITRRALSDEFGEDTSIPHQEKAVLFNDHTALIQKPKQPKHSRENKKNLLVDMGLQILKMVTMGHRQSVIQRCWKNLLSQGSSFSEMILTPAH